MKNSYGLPEEGLERVRQRDVHCVYCHKEMVPNSAAKDKRDCPTIEHLNHLPPWDNIETVAICCWSCNSSRGNRLITQWFEGAYCRERNINYDTVAPAVRSYIDAYEK